MKPAGRVLVSVVMPVFNGLPALPHAVESVRRQTLATWELVAVDDGSTDGSGEWLTAMAQAEPRLRVIRRDHRGIVESLNAGLASARGRFIARMDTDDVAHPDRLAAQIELLDREAGTGLVSSLVEFGGDRRTAAGYALHVDWVNSLVTGDAILLNRFIESPLAHPSVMFRRELVDRAGAYRGGDFPEDYELWLRWLDAGVRMSKVPRVLLTWNDPPRRLSRVDPRYAAEAFYRCKAVYLARWLRQHLDRDRRLLVWGAGRPTRKRAEYLVSEGIRIDGYIDIDPRKQGRRVGSRPVIEPAGIPGPDAAFVLGYVAKRGAREFQRACLKARGFVEGRDFLMAA